MDTNRATTQFARLLSKKFLRQRGPFIPQMMLKAGENELYINSDTPLRKGIDGLIVRKKQ